MSFREINRVLPGLQTTEGDGMPVRRPFPTRSLDHVDPFLLLDHFGPLHVKPGEGKGVPPHPHRGFQTVTYMLSGEFEHRDSQGQHGLLGAGDLQWMIAGDGVVHSEMPSRRFQQEGGTAEGFQLWVNLPVRDKRMPPKYQDIPSARVPEIQVDADCRVRVLAGSFDGVTGVVETRVPVLYLHVKFSSAKLLDIPIPTGWNTMVYVFRGSLGKGADALYEGSLALYGEKGDSVRLESESACEVLLISGEPLKEPVVRYGPFVMNTEAEIYEAISDYRSGKLGKENGQA